MKADSPIGQFYTVAELKNAFGFRHDAEMRRALGNTKPSGSRYIKGKLVAVYALERLPVPMQDDLDALRLGEGYGDVHAFMHLDKPTFRPCNRKDEPVKLSDVHPKEITKATKWRDALRPAFELLAANRAEWLVRAVESCRLVFGQTYTERHVREIIARTQRRARRPEDFERIDLFLPNKPARKSDESAEPQADDLAEVRRLMLELSFKKPEAGKTLAEREARDEWVRLDEKLWVTVFETFDQLTAAGTCVKTAKKRLLDELSAGWQDISRDTLLKRFDFKLANYRAGGLKDGRIAALKERQGDLVCEVTRQIEALGWFIPVARFFCLLTNRTETSGSMPEAIRRTVSLPKLPVGWKKKTHGEFSAKLAQLGLSSVPTCPASLSAAILQRQSDGKKLVPDKVARAIRSGEVATKHHRNPTDAALKYLNAPGSLFFITDRTTGERRPPGIGEVIEADDATINFPMCIPWTLGGDPCSDKYGVKVGRFQWLVSVDAASRYITAWSYIIRPRSSYRAEDALALMRAHCIQHGIPGQWRFEQGVWKSNLVKHAIEGIGSDLHTVWSPHQKPYIEGLFNTLWTKLSVQFPDSDVGRFRGESERANEILMACLRGQRDPRNHFPMVNDGLAAFKEVIAEKQKTPVHSEVGIWVPEERWGDRANLFNNYEAQALEAGQEFLFSPWVRDWKVKGIMVGGKIPLLEGFSLPVDFTADWLHRYDGARVRAHFDPTKPECKAMLVLAQDFKGKKAGTQLGPASLCNELASHVRMILGYGEDQSSDGRLARQKAAGALRREVRSVVPSGPAYEHSEERDGVSQVIKLERNKQQAEPTEKERSLAKLEELIAPTPIDRAAQVREIEELERQNSHLFA